jgi:hypothetical protein
MTYTQTADVYIGDASNQVNEFIRTPRPYIFLNPDRIDWRSGLDRLIGRPRLRAAGTSHPRIHPSR